jgi:hypothetical protein
MSVPYLPFLPLKTFILIDYVYVRSFHTLADEPSRTNLFWEMERRVGKGKEQGERFGNG